MCSSKVKHLVKFITLCLSGCDCHPAGAIDPQCDLSSGQCQCNPFVDGRNCDRCQYGYWNIDSGQGCQKCQCDPMGSLDHNCDDLTGQCQCRPGIGGPGCDACLVGFWGFSSSGCTGIKLIKLFLYHENKYC